MHFKDEKNIISIIKSGFYNYSNFLVKKQFIFVFYNDENKKYEYKEIIFKEDQFKHLCGISDNKEDVKLYGETEKEIVSAKEFYKLCEKSKLKTKHIILKKDGSSLQKMNILNNLYKLTQNETLYCALNGNSKKLEADFMIGLKNGNITIALRELKSHSIPISSLEFDIKDTKEKIFEILLVAHKKQYSSQKYSNITLKKVNIDFLPPKIRNLFKI